MLKIGLNTVKLAKPLAAGRQYRVRVKANAASVDLFRNAGDARIVLPLQGERLQGETATVKTRDVDYKDFVETEHVPWAKPLEGGKLRIFATWGEITANRMVNEIMQRVDADVDTVTMATGAGVGWGFCGPLYGVRSQKDIDDGLKGYLGGEQKYDVIVLGGDFAYESCLGDRTGSLILDRVKNGAGLVYCGMAGISKMFAEALPVKRAFGRGSSEWSLKDTAYNPITAGIPIGQMGSGITKYIGVKPGAQLLVSAGVDGTGADATENPLLTTCQYGKGRIVVLSGLASGEEGMAFLTKAILWAAALEPAVKIASLATDRPTAWAIRRRCGSPPKARRAGAMT